MKLVFILLLISYSNLKNMSHNIEELLLMLDEKIIYGEDLIHQLQCVENVEGVLKLQRKIYQEVDFLKRVG